MIPTYIDKIDLNKKYLDRELLDIFYYELEYDHGDEYTVIPSISALYHDGKYFFMGKGIIVITKDRRPIHKVTTRGETYIIDSPHMTVWDSTNGFLVDEPFKHHIVEWVDKINNIIEEHNNKYKKEYEEFQQQFLKAWN